MATIVYKDERFAVHDGETVLDALLRNGVEVPHSCRTGVCRSCTMVASAGSLPESAQAPLREIERRQGMFLACVCRPSDDLEVREIGDAGSTAAELVEVAHLSESVVRLRVRAREPFAYEPGQYLSLRRADGLTRSYSLASIATEPWLELHIRRVAGGSLSRWAYDEARPGDALTIRGPYGSCCYVEDQPEAPMLLVAVGTGLAPLWGIARQALALGHRGPITLIQAAAEPAGLYMRSEVHELARTHTQLRVRSCVLRGGSGELEQGAVDELAVRLVRESGEAAAHLAYVCGDPAVVHRVRRSLFMAGVSARRIFADAFVVGSATTA